MTQPRAVLWDMDGTLIDSTEDHWEAWLEIFAEEGYSMTRAEFSALFGRRNTDFTSGYLGTCPPEHVDRIAREKELRYQQRVRRRGTKFIPGAGEVVANLAAQGWRQAIATAAPRGNADAVMEALGIGQYFGTIVSSEDVKAGKPDPAVFLLAAERLGVEPASCIVFEDAPAGIEGARRAGMKSVGVVSALHPTLAADMEVSNFEKFNIEKISE